MEPEDDQDWAFFDLKTYQESQGEESTFVSDFEPWTQPADGLTLADDQYIIDPDYMEREGLTDFEQLIRTKK